MGTHETDRLDPPHHGFLDHLVMRTRGQRFETLPEDVVEMAKLCLLDWLGVTVAAAEDPLVDILVADALDDTAKGKSAVIGRSERTGTLQAILINGAAGHALDYDDSNPMTMGHPSAALAPVVLGLGEAARATGRDVLVAFVAGYEAMAMVTSVMGKRHYRLGFHGTATMGAFGATGAAIRLLGLDDAAARNAFGIAGTRAAGLRASFGTMCKPLHAGNAAFVGASAARWAARGYTGALDIFSDPRGFPATHGAAHDGLAHPLAAETFAIRSNLFKWHAACHLTHAAIDALTALKREHGIMPGDVAAVTLRMPTTVEGVCDIASPKSGLEAKFSLPMTAAFALTGIDTANPLSFSDATIARADLVALAARVTVVLDSGVATGARVEVNLADGQILKATCDQTIAEPDRGLRIAMVRAKFLSLAAPLLGDEQSRRLADAVMNLEHEAGVAALMNLTRPATGQAVPTEILMEAM